MSPVLQRKVEVGDIVQETLAHALDSLGRFQWEGEQSFRRWLNGIARNVILKAARTHEVPLEPGYEMDVPQGGPSPSRVLRREERFDRLQEALEALTPEQREVVLLSRIEGLKAKEIAARTGRSEDAVKQLMLRGLRSLRRGVGDTESLHLPDRRLDAWETSQGSSGEGEPE
jgi:RNA polymerase sigma-70 factor (ECF subfamily)